jgi:hypothetical protein
MCNEIKEAVTCPKRHPNVDSKINADYFSSINSEYEATMNAYDPVLRHGT